MTKLAEEGSGVAKEILEIISTPQKLNRFFTVAQVGITLVSLALGMYGEHTLADALINLFEKLEWGLIGEAGAHSISIVLAVGFLTYLHVVIGEMVPKSLALQSPEKTIFSLYRIMWVFEKLAYPLIWVMNSLGNLLSRLFGLTDLDSEERLHTSQEIEYLTEESFAGGLLDQQERLLIENIIDLEDRDVSMAMTPRNNMNSLSIEMSFTEIYEFIRNTNNTRYPVFIQNIDNIFGILYLKDFTRFIINNEDKSEFDIKKIVQPVIFVPETLPLSDMLNRFRSENFHIAIVFNEYGGTAGVISLEDIIEEVVGEIQDEFDKEIDPIEEISKTKLRVRGDVILEELEQLYDLRFDYDEVNTIGGFVMARLGRMPKENDLIKYKNISIKVEKLDGLAVNSVLIEIN
jgi:CBS domain containing-hemolysin-like protein